MPRQRKIRRPPSWESLFHAFERARESGHLFEFVSDGIVACISNADSLAEDLAILIANKRAAAAQFVYAACMEEMGKALILFDTIRADCRQNGRLKQLCLAFYNHLNKYGYAKTVRLSGSRQLETALELYRLELVEYWPRGNLEDGQPDMPADGFAHREWAIYVDWVQFDGRWFLPPDSSLARFLTGNLTTSSNPPAQEDVKAILGPLVKANREGLFSPEALKIVHDALAPVYCSPGSDETVRGTLEQMGQRLEASGIHISSESIHSDFMKLPLYAVIFEQ